jgi:hypothetical protein
MLCRCLLQGFEPTSNVRCGSMLKEATEFSHQLKKVEGAVRRMAAANAELVSRGCIGRELGAALLPYCCQHLWLQATAC